MKYPLIGLLVGLILGGVIPIHVPQEYSKFMAVALMAGLDSVFGGIRASFEEAFDSTVFISGFFTNTLLAACIVYIGERLMIDLYFVAILTFGLRMFQNIAIIRRFIFKNNS